MAKRSNSGITSGGGSGGASVGGGSSASAQVQSASQAPQPQPQVVATASQANSANNARFKDTDNSPYHDLYNGRQYYQDQTFGIDTRMAIQDYLQNDPDPRNGTYSPSQILNYKMRQNAINPNSMPLDANEQFMVDSLMDGMHNMGYNVNLTRYTRVDYMQNLGVGNFNNMTESQLKSALIGVSYKDPAFGSYSYNDFKNAPPNNVFTDKAVRIVRRTKASTQVLMPGNGPGGALGEIVTAPNQGVHIVDVRFTGKRGRSGGNWYKQVEIIVEDD